MVDIEINNDFVNFKLFKKNRDVYDIIDSFLEKNVSDEAFCIIDIGKVINQYNQMVEKLPIVKPYYAIKCNPNLVNVPPVVNPSKLESFLRILVKCQN